MAVDVSPWFQDCADLAERSVSERARGLEGSQILKIAGIERSETLIAFRAFSRYNMERMFSIGNEEPPPAR